MSGTAWVFWVSGAALAVVYGATQVLNAPGWGRSWVKTGSVLALAGMALFSGAPLLLGVALLASALGDWMLSRPGEDAFLAGVAAFAAGHIAYIALFLAVPEAGIGQVEFAGYIFAWTFLVLGLAVAVILWPRVGPLRGPVMGYLAIILGMGFAALMVPGTGALRLVLAGALLFVASDTVLALERFVFTGDHPLRAHMARFIWASYWGAQALFTLAFCLSA